jgi:rod shape-determining protein MreD
MNLMVGRPEPSPGLLRRIDALARAALPTFTTALLLVLAAGPTGVPALVPATALPCVFFWSLFRPGAMPPPAVFALGALQDLLTLAPLGIGVVTLLVAHGLAVAWRRFLARQSFLFVWLGFCGFALGVAGLGYVLTAVLSWQVPPLPPALHQAALSAGLYPAFAFLLGRAHAMMTRAEDTL